MEQKNISVDQRLKAEIILAAKDKAMALLPITALSFGMVRVQVQ